MADFPSRDKAEAYAKAVDKLGLRTAIWDSQKEMNEAGVRAVSNRNQNDTDPKTGLLADVFPFEVPMPIVLVERFVDEAAESQAEAMVSKYGGVFAGT
jgi:hypothetical protein